MGQWTEQILSEMTWEELIGQLILSSVGKQKDLVLQLAEEGKVGSVIFYGKDMPNPHSACKLANEFQSRAKIPILIASDFEAGTGFIVAGGTKLPSNMAIGASGSTELAYRCGEVTAKESRALGIHCVFAPVVDVNVNPANPIINIRSFGSDPDEVAKLAVGWIRGCQANGCLATAKHFPGHGDTVEDSHRAMPIVPHDLDRMWRVELRPFQSAIDIGVSGIMSAHIHFPAIDPTPSIPATLSRLILNDLLRLQMKFQGIVFTDSMAMWAIKHNFDPSEAAVMAINAGADVLLVDDPLVTYNAISKAVCSKILPIERVRQSARRVLESKEKCGLHENRFVDESKGNAIVGCRSHQEVAHKVAEASVTLIRNEGILPLQTNLKVFSVIVETKLWTGEKPSDEVAELLRQNFPKIDVHFIDPNPPTEQVWTVQQRMAEGTWDCALLSLFPRAEAFHPERAWAESAVVELGQRLSRHAPLLVASFGNPYPLSQFGMAKALLCTYSNAPVCMEAGIKVLIGKLPAKGKLPVKLTEL